MVQPLIVALPPIRIAPMSCGAMGHGARERERRQATGCAATARSTAGALRLWPVALTAIDKPGGPWHTESGSREASQRIGPAAQSEHSAASCEQPVNGSKW